MAKLGRCTVIANYKGGVGKSTIASHLAAYQKAVLIDMDRTNVDAQRFGEDYKLDVRRGYDLSAGELYDLVEKLKGQGRKVVIDCPPGDSPLTKLAALVSDLVVCPTRPGHNDVVALGRVNLAVREVREERRDLPYLYILNFYRNTQIARMFQEMLESSKEGRFVGKLWERVEYSEAVSQGKPVWESHPNSTGAKEMMNLVQFLDHPEAFHD